MAVRLEYPQVLPVSRICTGRRSIWCRLSGLVLVAVEAFDPDRIECLKVALAHPSEGQPIEPGVVGDEADHTPAVSSAMRRPPYGRSEHRDRLAPDPQAGARTASSGRLPKARVPHQPPYRQSRYRAGCRGSRGSAFPASPAPRGRVLPPALERAADWVIRGSHPVSALVRKMPARSIPSVVSGASRSCMVNPTCRWATTKGAGMILEAEHAPGRRLLDPCTGERAQAPIFQIGHDAAQYSAR